MKLILYISSVIFLSVSQWTVANPLPGDQYELDEHNKLYKHIVMDYETFSLPVFEKYEEVFTKVLEDLKNHEQSTDYEAEKKQIEDFSNVYHTLKSSDGENKLSTVLELQKNLISGYEYYKPESRKENLVRQLLLKHGEAEVIEEVRKSFQDLDEDFQMDVETYVKELSADQKETHAEVLKWFEMYKKEKTTTEKYKEFLDFFTFFHHD